MRGRKDHVGPGRGARPPRPTQGAEHNLIQRPELIRALTQAMGVRQAHVAPTLQEGVQPVIILDNLSDRVRVDTRRVGGAALQGSSGAGAAASFVGLWNPVGSGILVQVMRATWMAVDELGTSNITTLMGMTRLAAAADMAAGGGVETNVTPVYHDSRIPAGDGLTTAQPMVGRTVVGQDRTFGWRSSLGGFEYPQHIFEAEQESVMLDAGMAFILQLTTSAASHRLYACELVWNERPLGRLD